MLPVTFGVKRPPVPTPVEPVKLNGVPTVKLTFDGCNPVTALVSVASSETA